ncbi:rhodanese-like domain-containing protein [Actinotalea sp. K2]|uniref:rhodanese-like domain-containing protein n=1 Tax=Actinotalea sp. K2 TaxID=2939438 RepID=UPI002016C9C6|nr:rhodanese-like domain-containing protein [Actinotalea sp. K2]MCL3862235.1 rhodanese-like domain-containing protein [Actinotalea sp. K2]
MRPARPSPRGIAITLATTVALLLGPTACSSGPATPAAQGATDLDASEFAELVAREGTVVLDVRTPAEFAEGHLPGAVNLDLSSGEFPQQVAALDTDLAYAVYCRSGNRSDQALAIMRESGFTDAAHLEGGILTWTQAGGAVVRE